MNHEELSAHLKLAPPEISFLCDDASELDLVLALRLVTADFLRRSGFSWAVALLVDQKLKNVLLIYGPALERGLKEGKTVLCPLFLEILENHVFLFHAGDGFVSDRWELETGKKLATGLQLPGWSLSCSIVCIFLRTLATIAAPAAAEDFAAGRITLGRST